MGSNASKSTSAYSVRNYSTILRNGNAFKLGDLDVSERHLLLELRRIILMDELLDVIVERSLPKPGKVSRASHERMSTEDLWSTIWGKVVTNIRDEILYNAGVEADTKLQRRFRNRFRVPFSMFETMVVECKDFNVQEDYQCHYQWGLMSKKTIPAHEEILWNYGPAYIYPSSD